MAWFCDSEHLGCGCAQTLSTSKEGTAAPRYVTEPAGRVPLLQTLKSAHPESARSLVKGKRKRYSIPRTLELWPRRAVPLFVPSCWSGVWVHFMLYLLRYDTVRSLCFAGSHRAIYSEIKWGKCQSLLHSTRKSISVTQLKVKVDWNCHQNVRNVGHLNICWIIRRKEGKF